MKKSETRQPILQIPIWKVFGLRVVVPSVSPCLAAHNCPQPQHFLEEWASAWINRTFGRVPIIKVFTMERRRVSKRTKTDEIDCERPLYVGSADGVQPGKFP